MQHAPFLNYGRGTNGRTNGRTDLQPCQIWSKSVKPRPTYGDFSIFQDGCCHHLGLLKCYIFNGRAAQKGRSTSPAKFRRNRLTRCWDMAICRFFQDGGRPPSWICDAVFGPPTKAIWWSLSLCKIISNQCSSFDNMQVLIFCEFGVKTPIHPQGGFWWFDPLNSELSHPAPQNQKPLMVVETRPMSH